MKKIIIRYAVALVAIASQANALVILNTTSSLLISDLSQLGRMTRDNVASDWSTNKVFPGVTAPSTTFHYQVFNLDPVALSVPYVQISTDDPLGVVFVNAYMDNYLPIPNPNSTNYLGDAGSTGNPAGNPGFFQVVVPNGHTLVVVVNSLATTPGVGSFGLLVEGFVDSNFTDVPEPATMTMSAAGLLAGIALVIRKNSQKPPLRAVAGVVRL